MTGAESYNPQAEADCLLLSHALRELVIHGATDEIRVNQVLNRLGVPRASFDKLVDEYRRDRGFSTPTPTDTAHPRLRIVHPPDDTD